MKPHSFALLRLATLLVSCLVAVEASAVTPQTRPRVEPVETRPVFVSFSWAKGTLTVPTDIKLPGATGWVAASCADFVVVATSERQIPRPAGYTGFWVGGPKWSHSARATGSISSGSCSYAVIVVHGESFNLRVSGETNPGLRCEWLTATDVEPPQAGWFKVKLGGTKEQDFTVGGLACSNLH